MLKALFVVQIFMFLPWHFYYREKHLAKKVKVNQKLLTSETGQQIIAVHILPKISIRKENKAMKFLANRI